MTTVYERVGRMSIKYAYKSKDPFSRSSFLTATRRRTEHAPYGGALTKGVLQTGFEAPSAGKKRRSTRRRPWEQGRETRFPGHEEAIEQLTSGDPGREPCGSSPSFGFAAIRAFYTVPAGT